MTSFPVSRDAVASSRGKACESAADCGLGFRVAVAQEDDALREQLQKLPHTPAGEVRVLQLAPKARALDTWELVCRRTPASLPDDMDRPLLLLPDGFRILPKSGLTKVRAAFEGGQPRQHALDM